MKQNQHKVPRVYLKKFGYRTPNNQWKVSVIKKGELFTRQKSIESFTSETNVFDIPSEDVEVRKAFENLNCDLENEYNRIIADIEKEGRLSDKSYVYLITLIANLICRSDIWRNQILQILKSPYKENFLHFTIGHISKSKEGFVSLPNQPFFRSLIEMSPEDSINRILLFFADHILLRLKEFEIVIIKSQKDKPWATTSNPIVAHNKFDYKKMEQFSKDSEFYFPLSPSFLVYLHFKNSDDKNNPLRKYPTNEVVIATDNENIKIQRLILSNPCEYAIFPGELTHKSELNLSLRFTRFLNSTRWSILRIFSYVKFIYLRIKLIIIRKLKSNNY